MSARSAVLGALALTLLSTSVAFADPAGKSTTDETIRPASGSGYVALQRRAGEDHGIRRHPSARPSEPREQTRRSLAFFGQLTDPQIADEMSPARVDFLDPAGNQISSSWRPQEALGPQVFDQTIRNINDNATSEIKDGRGKRAKLGFVVTTGDLADNQQLNETRWFKRVLEGGQVDPFSGKPISATNPCPGDAGHRRGAQRRRRRAPVHRRGRLRRLPRRRRPTLQRLLGPGRRAAGRRVRGVPALPGLPRARAAAVHRRGHRRAVVHRPRQPRRARPGQRAGQRRPVPLDRHRLPEGLPLGRDRPGAVRGRRRERGLPPDRRPGLHPDAAGRRAHASRRTRTAASSARPSTRREIGGSHGYRHVARPSARPPTATRPTTRSGPATASS